MGIGKVLGSVSPLAGALTGQGAFGKGLASMADAGYGPLIPVAYLAQNRRDRNLRRRAEEEAMPRMGMMGARGMAEDIARRSGAAPTMKKGGKVKAKAPKKMAKGDSTASKRGDGCATKGKTKGRFV